MGHGKEAYSTQVKLRISTSRDLVTVLVVCIADSREINDLDIRPDLNSNV